MTANGFRDFTPADYEGLAALHRAALPDYPESAEEIRFQDERRDPKCRHRRWVLERDGVIVASGNYEHSAWSYHPRRFHVWVAVHPELQGQGIGGALYDEIQRALEPFDPITLRSGAREDYGRSIRFLEDRGFREDMRERESRLDVRTFDPGPWTGAEEKPRSHGIEIRTLRELETDPDRNRKLWELNCTVEQDVPHSDPITPPDFDHWSGKHLENPNLLPDAYFVAVDGEQYVGVSVLWNSQEGDFLDTGLTGVRREYRRKGIALALKLRAVEYARRVGAPSIRTWNEQNNRAMLSINEALGFERQPAWIEYRKDIKE